VSHILGQIGATLTATLALSFLGTAGTLVGLALGSAMSAVLPTVYENLLRRSHHKAKLLRERQWQARTSASAAADHEFLNTSGEPATRPGISVPWKRIGIAALAVFAICAVTITIVEAIAGKPVSAVVTGTHGSGYTFSGGTSGAGRSHPAGPGHQHSPAPASTTPAVSPSPAASSSAPAAGTSSPATTTSPSAPGSPAPPAASTPGD
jgi:hypothetical protein